MASRCAHERDGPLHGGVFAFGGAGRRPKGAPVSVGRAARGEVRIVGGAWKRSKLPVADAAGLRPTPDRVRETLFNWLGQDLTGWQCLDAFAGSGALGFEAASRGAARVVLLERDSRLVRSLQASKLRLKADTLSVHQADALAWMARGVDTGFDLVFLDPPFDADLTLPALKAAERVLAPQGLVYLESGRAHSGDELAPLGYTLQRQARAGAVWYQLLRREPHGYTAPGPVTP